MLNATDLIGFSEWLVQSKVLQSIHYEFRIRLDDGVDNNDADSVIIMIHYWAVDPIRCSAYMCVPKQQT